MLQTAKMRPGPENSDGTVAMSLPATRSAKAESVTAPTDADPRAATERDPIGGLIQQIQETFFNQSPTAKPAQIRQEPDGTIIGEIGASDPDEDPLSYKVSERPQHGTVVIHANGDYTYTPNPEFASTGGTDTFTATVSETNASQHVHGPIGLINRVIRTVSFGLLNPNDGSYVDTPVTVNVTTVNGAPVAGRPEVGSPDPATGVVTGKVIATDPDGDTLTYTGSGVTPRGSVVVEADGRFTYTPTTQARLAAYSTVGADYDEFTITVTDGRGGTTTVAVKDIMIDDVHAAVTDTVTLPGAATGAIVFGADGMRYQTLVTRHGDGSQTTHVAVFRPDVDEPVLIDVPGAPVGNVVVGSDGAIHQTTLDYTAGGTVARVAIFEPGPENLAVVETPGYADGGVVLGPNGIVYQNTRTGTSENAVTHVTVIDREQPGNPITIDAAGFAAGGVVVAPNGTAYLTTGTGDHFDGYVTHVTVISPIDPANAVTFDLLGRVSEDPNSEGLPAPVTISGDGTAYQTTSTEGSTRVMIFRPDAPTEPTTLDIAGTAYGAVVIGPDGSAYQTTEILTANIATRVTVIDPADPARSIPIDLPGHLYRGGDTLTAWINGDVRFGPDGTVYQLTRTRSGGSNLTHVAVIDPLDPTHPNIVDVAGKPYDEGFVIGPDRIVYLTTRTGGYGTAHTLVTAIDPADAANATTIEVPGLAYYDDSGLELRGGAVVGANGTAYQLTFTRVGPVQNKFVTHLTLLDPTNPLSVDFPAVVQLRRAVVGVDGTAFVSGNSATLIQLAVVDPDSITNPAIVGIPGSTVGDLVFGPDGTAFQTTRSQPSTGRHFTQVTVINPAIPKDLTTIEFEGRPVGSQQLGPDGAVYQTTINDDTGESVIHVITVAPRPVVAV